MKTYKQNKLFERLKQYGYNVPWCQDEADDLGPCIMNFVWQKEAFYRRWSQQWFENFQFVYGNHNARWIKQFGFAVDYDFLQKKRAPSAKKSKTNISRLIAETLTAAIYARQPKWNVVSASESARQTKSITTIVQNTLDYFMKILDGETKFEIGAASFTTYGKVGAIIRWNNSSGLIKWVPKFRRTKVPLMTTVMQPDPVSGGLIEVQKQAIDSVGQPIFSDTWDPVIANDGSQMEEPKVFGSPEIIMLTPFEYRYEEGKTIQDAKWIEWVRLIDYDDVIREYDDIDGKTKHWDNVAPEFASTRVHQFAIRQFFRMHFVSPDFETQKPIDITTSSNYLGNKVLVIEHYDKPDVKRWPLGRRVIIMNGHCTHITTPDYSTNKVGGWHPFVEANWFSIAPSSMSAGAMNDVIQKNRELNVADSLIMTALHRNMGSSLLVKIGSGLDANRITGTPGETHEVSELDAAKWLHDDQPIPPAVPRIRQDIKDDVFEQSGAQDSLRGERSKGVSAGYALRQLQEREDRRIAPNRNRYERFVAQCAEKLIACFRQNVQQVGDDLIGYLKRSSSGEALSDEAISFLTRNIELGVDINIEPGSMQVESKATKQFNYLDIVTKTPFGQLLASDKKVADEFLKIFGAEGLRGYAGSHRNRAESENELFIDMMRLGPDKAGQSTPVVIFEDDDDIHIAEHTDFMVNNTQDILKNRLVMMMILNHVETHRIQLEEKNGKVAPGTAQSVRISQSMAEKQPIDPSKIQQENQMRKLQPQPANSPQQAQAMKEQPAQQQGQPKPPIQPEKNLQTTGVEDGSQRNNV